MALPPICAVAISPTKAKIKAPWKRRVGKSQMRTRFNVISLVCPAAGVNAVYTTLRG